ncbi:hypothetical protein SAMN05421800_12629 [Chryseobacterium balustinum]|uniref:Uncharacterized protein n=1 Tax=Chryseobacterium balustinum TaxID=246 RepID=A0AAX2IPY5_9FLAO|nr:hypothetical protein SAMN05421800_12629 [Chryseobacterium balustinum]SQA91825.1 Uncharacterised protein [Chryseobacterium balustinum]
MSEAVAILAMLFLVILAMTAFVIVSKNAGKAKK